MSFADTNCTIILKLNALLWEFFEIVKIIQLSWVSSRNNKPEIPQRRQKIAEELSIITSDNPHRNSSKHISYSDSHFSCHYFLSPPGMIGIYMHELKLRRRKLLRNQYVEKDTCWHCVQLIKLHIFVQTKAIAQ